MAEMYLLAVVIEAPWQTNPIITACPLPHRGLWFCQKWPFRVWPPRSHIKRLIFCYFIPHFLFRFSHSPFTFRRAWTMPRDKKEQGTNANGHIPRPANSFILFRTDWLKKSIANSTQGDCVRQKQKDVSRKAGEAWNSLSPTLKQRYVEQAKLIKEEHDMKYPQYAYRPRPSKKRTKAVGDAAPDGPPTKRVIRGRTATPHQNPSVDAKGKRNAEATPFTPIAAQTESV